MMIRTQVQLTEDQLKGLRQLSTATGRSTADLIRSGIDQYLVGRGVSNREDRTDRAIRVAGMFSSGCADVSTDHDRHLAEAFQR